MAIRILHILDSLHNGGLENGVVNLVRHMDTRRFEHCICTVRDQGINLDRLPASRVKLLHLGKQAGERFQTPELRRAIREIRPDIVHSRNWGTIEAVIAARLSGSFATVHSEHGFEAGAEFRETWHRVCFRRLAFELADRVLCVSHQLRESHARRTRFPAHRITVIHNGVDSTRFSPDLAARARMRRELDINADAFCVGCVGNLSPVKDYPTLLRALTDLGVARNWHVLIAGEGPERSHLEDLARSDQRGGCLVSFLGSSSRVPELLNAFDAYVLPSLNEGISNSLLEAMSTGLPVIASAVGGNPEVVEDGLSGLLFPTGNSRQLAEHLLSLRAQSGRRERLGKEARRRMRDHFSIESMVRSYEDFYATLTLGDVTAEAAVKA